MIREEYIKQVIEGVKENAEAFRTYADRLNVTDGEGPYMASNAAYVTEIALRIEVGERIDSKGFAWPRVFYLDIDEAGDVIAREPVDERVPHVEMEYKPPIKLCELDKHLAIEELERLRAAYECDD